MRIIVLFTCFQIAFLTEAPCVIELSCLECVPDNMPLVTSHRAANGSVVVPAGEQLTLSCGGGRLLAYPLRSELVARCEDARYRLAHDSSLRHLLELGCQEDVFEDVLHDVEHCSAPYQGRAYQTRDAARGVSHLAALCFDEDSWQARFAHVSNAPHNALRLPAHSERRAPLTLLGNFNHMFDASTRLAAEHLYSDEVRLNRRLHEMFKHDQYNFADQRLTSGKLLSGRFFDDQNVRVTEFVSNAVPVWGSVARGNLQHLHADVAALLAAARDHAPLHVYCGTHGVGSLRTAAGPRPLFLKPGRFPVPKYVWCVVHDERAARALAVAVTNDPFVSVSEVRDTVACESACGRVRWLRELRAHRRYETPLYGLTFCCEVHNFTALVPEMPPQVIRAVPRGPDGMLTHSYQ
ncbi:uncharacterized protein LOC126976534 [Leptidea sinapis]|uniref:uncharacterized protein LOC126976534 n=1 Tax=Leptidea sinapis TaxID=189913 RepID=UPI0021C2BD16|nr:uncharacterized protein LOC126976534 [Leptidea sinapis]